MSETEARQLLERWLAAFNASDHALLLDCLSENVILDLPGGRQIGRDKAQWILGEMMRHLRQNLSDIVVLTAPDGLHAAAEFTVLGTYLATIPGFPQAHSQQYRLSAGLFLEIEDDRISRITPCFDAVTWERQVTSQPQA